LILELRENRIMKNLKINVFTRAGRTK